MSKSKPKGTRPTFADLAVAKTYLFNVETPDGDLYQFEFREPPQSEIWAIELSMPPRPEPPLGGFEGTFEGGDWKPKANPKDPAYLRAVSEWASELVLRKILVCWTEEVPGDTQDDKLDNLRALPNWVISGLARCLTMVTAGGQAVLADQPF